MLCFPLFHFLVLQVCYTNAVYCCHVINAVNVAFPSVSLPGVTSLLPPMLYMLSCD